MSSILKSVSAGSLAKCQTSRTSRQEYSIIDILDSSTGFGENRVLHNVTSCKKPAFKTPLYQENYLGEFKTEEEKAAARRALGLFNKGDVVAMSLLTAEDSPPSIQQILNTSVKQLRKGDQFFSPATTFNAVYDSHGVTLTTRLLELNSLIVEQKNSLLKLTQVSNSKDISSLGDVKLFLQGFTNGDTLRNSLDEMNKEMLRFESIGQITT